MRLLIVDLTRAYVGSERKIFEQARALYDSEDIKTLVIRRQNQASFDGPGVEEIIMQIAVNVRAVASSIGAKLLSELQSSDDIQVGVVTASRAVFELAEALPEDLKQRTEVTAYSSLRPIQEKAADIKWPSDVMPIETAFAALKESLRAARAVDASSSIRKSMVRQFLNRIEPRFRKSHPLGAMDGIISLLIEAACQRGIVESDGDSYGPRIWLTDKGALTSRAPIIPIKKTRSQIFIETLVEAGLGPFSRIRGKLYDSLEEVLLNSTAAGLELTAGQLVTRAIDAVRKNPSRGSDESDMPWRSVRAFLTHLLALRPVLVSDDGQNFSASFSTLSRTVTGLKANWRLDLDGELILTLVRASLDVQLADVPSIAGALFLSRDDNSESQAQHVVEHLLRMGWVRESPRPPYRLMLGGDPAEEIA